MPVLLSAQIASIGFKEVPIEINGRKGGRITDIGQDQNGYLWLTSADGLLRYDGYDFKAYRSFLADSTAQYDGGNEALFIDHTGVLWTGTSTGVARYEPDCDCFAHYRFAPDDWVAAGNYPFHIRAFAEDPELNLWMVHKGGLYRYEREQDRFTRFLDDPEDPDAILEDIVRVLLADREGNIWMGTGYGAPQSGSGLVRFNPRTGAVKRFSHDPEDSNSLVDNRVSALLEDQEGKIWVGTYQCGLHLYQPDRENFTRMTPDAAHPERLHAPCTDDRVWGNDPFVQVLHQDRDGGYWVGTIGANLHHFDGQRGRLSVYDIRSLSETNNHLWSFYEDRQGVIWLGLITLHSLFKMDPWARKYHIYPELKVVQPSMESRKEPGVLWIATFQDGLHRLNTSTGKSTVFLHDKKDNNSIGNNSVRVAYEDRDGILWVGLGDTRNAANSARDEKFGLARLDPKTGTFKHYPIGDKSTTGSSSIVYNIFDDQQGVLWLNCFQDGLFRFDKQTGIAERYEIPGSGNNSISPIWQIGANTLWVCDMKRKILFRYNEQEDAFHSFLEGYATTFVMEEDSSRFWIGTWDQGLLYYNPIDSTVTQYTVADGLPSNREVSFVKDESGLMWIATQGGLAKFDPKTRQFSSNGLPDANFVMTPFKAGDGQLFFSGQNGLIGLYPDEFRGNPFPPEVLISGVQISGESFLPSMEKPGAIRLSHRENNFRFEYVGLHYSDPAQNTYRYQLSPFDQNWMDAGTERVARYTNLEPGNYHFRVKAANSDGVWQEAAATFDFRIRPPWWQTWWAYGLFLLIAVLIIRWMVQNQRKKLQLKQQELDKERRISERLQEVDRLKDQFLANTSHELRTPLHGIIGLSETLHEQLEDEEQRKNVEMVIASGIRLTNLVNDILDFSKLKTQEIELNLQAVDLPSIVDMVLRMSRGLLDRKGLRLTAEIPDGLPAVQADEDRLQQILLNLIGNAIKFTQEGEVIVSAQKEGANFLKISVSDTGIGIPEDKIGDVFQSFEQGDASIQRQYGGTGLGLTITRQLVELHGGAITVESVVDEGSVFSFTLPVATGEAVATPVRVFADKLTPLQLVETPAVSPPVAAEQLAKEVPRGRYHVLIVDDDPVNRQVMSNYLNKDDFIISEAANGSEAIELLEKEDRIDIVLLDIMMPGMSGYEVCQQIRKHYLPNELPVLMLTAKNQVTDLVEALKIDANDYLVKPISKKELLARLGTHLNLLHINQSYSRFVPKEFFKVLGKDNVLDVQLGDQVEKEVTVMFTDIRGYTSLSESMTAADNFKFLNAYLKKAVPIINDHHGLVQHFLGDGLMSLFMDKPSDAVAAAITLLKMVTQYSLERMAKSRRALKVGIGLHTGTLMMGIIGNENRMDPGVVSDTVNTASRMEGLTKYFGVSLLVSETVVNGLEDPYQFNYRYLGKVQVKGKKKALRIYDFYDGETAEIVAIKERTQEDFEAGLQHYYAKNFTAAALSFEKVLLSNPGDFAARLYQEKSSHLMETGIHEGWTGIEVMESK